MKITRDLVRYETYSKRTFSKPIFIRVIDPHNFFD